MCGFQNTKILHIPCPTRPCNSLGVQSQEGTLKGTCRCRIEQNPRYPIFKGYRGYRLPKILNIPGHLNYSTVSVPHHKHVLCTLRTNPLRAEQHSGPACMCEWLQHTTFLYVVSWMYHPQKHKVLRNKRKKKATSHVTNRNITCAKHAREIISPLHRT